MGDTGPLDRLKEETPWPWTLATTVMTARARARNKEEEEEEKKSAESGGQSTSCFMKCARKLTRAALLFALCLRTKR